MRTAKVRSVLSGKVFRNCYKPNPHTGEPRRWVYGKGGKLLVNLMLELAEAYDYIYRVPRKHRDNGYLDVPLKVRNSMAKEMIKLAGYLRANTKSELLTEHELRYCKLEGISPEDFAERKQG
jgi:hypothetical protein